MHVHGLFGLRLSNVRTVLGVGGNCNDIRWFVPTRVAPLADVFAAVTQGERREHRWVCLPSLHIRSFGASGVRGRGRGECEGSQNAMQRGVSIIQWRRVYAPFRLCALLHILLHLSLSFSAVFFLRSPQVQLSWAYPGKVSGRRTSGAAVCLSFPLRAPCPSPESMQTDCALPASPLAPATDMALTSFPARHGNS